MGFTHKDLTDKRVDKWRMDSVAAKVAYARQTVTDKG